MKKLNALLTLSAALALGSFVSAQLNISSTNSATVINFNNNSTISGVWGPSTNVNLSGFSPTPNNDSPFDSDAWAVRVSGSQNYTIPLDLSTSTGSVGFGGGPQTIGAVARGLSPTAAFGSGSGLGIATSLNNVIGNNGLAFRPTGTGTDNATVWLRIQNTTGQTINQWNVSYLGYYINIGSYATPVAFSYSTDGGTTFASNVSALGFTTPGTNTVTTPTAADWVQVTGLSSTINATVTNNSFLLLRFGLGQDIAVNLQDGNRIAIDDISISAIPEPSTLVLLGIALGSMWFFRRRKS